MSESSLMLNKLETPLCGEPRLSLADFLREAGATSIHLGCEHGVCGGCNVLVDGQAMRSCLMLAQACNGVSITSLEGLNDELAQRLRAAFSRHHALQCGFCTPGVFITAYELLTEERPLNEDVVRERLAGNICRCTGYQGMVDAVLDVASQRSRPDHCKGVPA